MRLFKFYSIRISLILLLSISVPLFLSQISFAEIRLVFSTDIDTNRQIYILEDLQDEPVKLTNSLARDYQPVWCSNGEKIAFVSDRSGNKEIYLMDIDALSVQQLTHNPGDDICPTCSPDGEKIAFISERDRSYDLYIIEISTGEIRRLTDCDAACPIAWSPDGEKIAFASVATGSIYLINASRVDPATSVEVLEIFIPLPPNARAFFDLSWSPSQRKVAFSVYDKFSSTIKIYTMDLSTGNLRDLTNSNRHSDRNPCWSPDGQFIAFSSNREESVDGGDIYFMTPEGKVIKQLKLNGFNYDPDIFDPNFVYAVFPEGNSKACTWGEIKR